MDIYTALADPTRREILARLRRRESSVNELAERLDISQPTMSKHLKVLREAGFLSSRIAAQQRIYQLEPEPFREIAKWLDPYIRLWTTHLDALERHLDRHLDHREKKHAEKSVPARQSRERSRGKKR